MLLWSGASGMGLLCYHWSSGSGVGLLCYHGVVALVWDCHVIME